MHNVVNKRLHKPAFDCAWITDVYQCGCADADAPAPAAATGKLEQNVAAARMRGDKVALAKEG